jgi:hypothetical protein
VTSVYEWHCSHACTLVMGSTLDLPSVIEVAPCKYKRVYFYFGLVFLLPNNFKLFNFPIFWFWASLMKVIPEKVRNKLNIHVLIKIYLSTNWKLNRKMMYWHNVLSKLVLLFRTFSGITFIRDAQNQKIGKLNNLKLFGRRKTKWLKSNSQRSENGTYVWGRGTSEPQGQKAK